MESGNFKREEYTPEEREILGKDEPAPQKVEPEPTPKEEPPKETETPAETEQTPVPEPEKTPEQKFKIDGDFIVYEDGERIPVERFSKVYKQAKDGERLAEKHNLLKQLGQEEYFRLYPDEAPQGWKPKGAEPTPQVENDPFNMVVQGGQYNGMTLREVWDIDSKEGFRLHNDWKDAQVEAKAAAREKEGKLKSDTEKELSSFATERAKELFDKAPDAMTEVEKKQVSDSITATIEWMQKTGRGGGIMQDAWRLMNYETALAKARESATKGTIDALKKPVVGSIDTNKGTPVETEFGKYASMTREQLGKEFDRMTDKEFVHFKKNAPESVRKKFADLF